jgi:hypothetical protein
MTINCMFIDWITGIFWIIMTQTMNEILNSYNVSTRILLVYNVSNRVVVEWEHYSQCRIGIVEVQMVVLVRTMFEEGSGCVVDRVMQVSRSPQCPLRLQRMQLLLKDMDMVQFVLIYCKASHRLMMFFRCHHRCLILRSLSHGSFN